MAGTSLPVERGGEGRGGGSRAGKRLEKSWRTNNLPWNKTPIPESTPRSNGNDYQGVPSHDDEAGVRIRGGVSNATHKFSSLYSPFPKRPKKQAVQTIPAASALLGLLEGDRPDRPGTEGSAGKSKNTETPQYTTAR
jgi:hypothetical protein